MENISLDCFRPLTGMMFYQPPPSEWGRWRATRAGRGACDCCCFLTIERQYRSWRPYHRCAVPLPRGERSTSSNHTSLTLVFLGRFPIRPVSQSASSYGLASWTGQQRGRLGLRVSVPLRGCIFELNVHTVFEDSCYLFPSPCGDVVLKLFPKYTPYFILPNGFPSPYGDVFLKYRRIRFLCV